MSFYQIEVNRIAHTGTNASYGDTVALIKDRQLALKFAREYSDGTDDRQQNCVVHITGHSVDRYYRNGKECHWHGRFVEPVKPKAKRTDMKALREKAAKHGGCGRRTDRELAQLYRSSGVGSGLLFEVHREMARRDLLNPSKSSCGGYGTEKLKNISDYPEDQKTPRNS